jgi:2-iminobutanoate/2-iminopropanoate deaminase
MAIKAYDVEANKAHQLPYSPVVSVDLPGMEMIFLSGMSPLPLYHSHPHVKEETMIPDDAEEQTRRASDKIKIMLAERGATMKDIVKVTKYVTDFRDADIIHAVLAEEEYFGDWKPVSTTIGVHSLSAPGSRLELDVIAVKVLDQE